MSQLTDLIGLGMPPEQANVLAFDTLIASTASSVSAAVTAAGTNLATATALTSLINNVSTAASGTGVALSAITPIGVPVIVRNGGANDLKVYTPVATDAINGGTGSITLTTLAKQVGIFYRVNATTWIASVATGT